MDELSAYLTAPAVVPPLDPGFRPAELAVRSYERRAGLPVGIALEQADGSVYHTRWKVLAGEATSAVNAFFLERLVKTLLWVQGGWRLWIQGPASLQEGLRRHYAEDATGRFDSEIIGERIYDHPISVVNTPSLPPARATSAPLGRHLDGCRIGFDLGGSDRKVAAVEQGRVVYSEEVVWDPYFQADPQYHFDGIMDSLRKAAAHLPRVDAIGGSAAGVYVNNRVRVASLFRGVSRELFESRVKDLFLEIRRAWGGIPLEVVNDGEVTALAGSMSLGQNAVLGLSMGTSTAGGYVTPDGNITTWLNELAFAPVDFRPNAPRDEWSGDFGCGVQYFSQQAVARLMGVAGIECDPGLPLPEKLKVVQKRMEAGDGRAAQIYESIGVYLGYSLAYYTRFYDLRHVLVLGRVTSGRGGDVILSRAAEVLQAEFPELAGRLSLHMPDEKEKRHGQAIAAASLPVIGSRDGR